MNYIVPVFAAFLRINFLKFSVVYKIQKKKKICGCKNKKMIYMNIKMMYSRKQLI